MAAQKPSIPKGTRDFSPEEMVKRNYLFDTIRKVFQRYGYMPIETPAMENLSTLMGKYGEEGDKLIFKIINSGNFLDSVKVRKHVLKDIGEDNFSKLNLVLGENYPLQNIVSPNEIIGGITEKALRYDLTVPFARYVVQHQSEINFPFKRYQIQPVWRADRPQKGRYREFYQCDADVIGSDSLMNEVELIHLIDDVFTKLGISVTIKINNRKILAGLAKYLGIEDGKLMDFVVALDKIDKIGYDAVALELNSKGIILKDKAVESTDHNVLSYFKEVLAESPQRLLDYFKIYSISIGEKGADELLYIFNIIAKNLKTAKLELDITLARGLNYYTGAIFEVKANAGTLSSSICGGGRYDDLTGIFGLPDVSGVGISFGADRIYDVMSELDLFPKEVTATTKLLFTHFGEAERDYCLPLLAQVRGAGINSELYPDLVKIKKQFDYANKKGIAYVAVVGSDEMKEGNLMVKNMADGTQEKLKIYELIGKLKEEII